MTAIDPEIAGVFTDTPADLQLLLDQYVAYEAAPADYQSEGEVVPEGKPYDAAAEEMVYVAGDQDAIVQERAGRAELLAAIESAPGIDAAPAPVAAQAQRIADLVIERDAARDEIAQVVAWLRVEAKSVDEYWMVNERRALNYRADAIEAGQHKDTGQ
jgi:hypothetical protein